MNNKKKKMSVQCACQECDAALARNVSTTTKNMELVGRAHTVGSFNL